MQSDSKISKSNISLIQTNSYKHISSLELVKLCSTTQSEYLWNEFYQRFNPYIKSYIRKAWKTRVSAINVDSSITKETLKDLTQDVYVKLLDSNLQALKRFQGENETSFLAYLSKIATNIVAEFFRKQLSDKRRGHELSIQALMDNELCTTLGSRALTNSYLSIDGEKSYFAKIESHQVYNFLKSKLKGSNLERDLLVFKLSVVEGMTSKQIVAIENLELKPTSVESVVRRIKSKMRLLLKSSLQQEDASLPKAA